MAQEGKRAERLAIKLEKSQVDQIDLSKVPLGKKEETADVSAQFGMWISDPCYGETWHFSYLHLGWNLLRAGNGCVWNEFITL
jgi:hypothetical protein